MKPRNENRTGVDDRYRLMAQLVRRFSGQFYGKEKKMKMGPVFSALVLMLVPALASAQGAVFCVKVGGDNLQTAQLGLNNDRFQPYIGVDYFSLGGKVEEGMGIQASLSLVVPHVGARYYFSSEPVRPYVYGGFFKAMASVKLDVAGEDMLDGDVKELLEDVLGFKGFKVGFGGEYRVNEHFGVGGEFGINLYSLSAEVKGLSDLDDIEIDDGWDDMALDLEAKVSASLRRTYAVATLNFNF
ncbi:MAG: hypothetical protein JXO72_14185 [Vicinamibacteria bacterium]|nr:hypothetical protein [Vicinamibacteria bacterium]